MTGPEPVEVADPFGATVSERLWRRLAGVGAIVVPVGAVLAVWTTEVLPWVLFGAAVAYLLGLPASWLATRRGGAPIRRHAVLAVGLGVLVAAALAVPTDEPLAWWGVFAAFAVGFGVPIAVAAAWAAGALPARWVRPVAVLGLAATLVALPVATWFAVRPPAPHDFVVVHEPELVREQFADAYALAVVLAERFEQRAADGEPRTAHATWVAIGEEFSSRELDGVASWMRFRADHELPRMPGTGRPVRLVTTIFDGDGTRGCVVLTAEGSRAEPQACAALELSR